jgi:hypothetical protein
VQETCPLHGREETRRPEGMNQGLCPPPSLLRYVDGCEAGSSSRRALSPSFKEDVD